MIQIGLGTSSLNLQAAENLFNEAHNLGVQYVDTAPLYGASEKLIGKFNLNRFNVCTKFGLIPRFKFTSTSTTLNQIISSYAELNPRPIKRIDLENDVENKVMNSLSKSLKNLEVEKVKIFLYHSASSKYEIEIVKPVLEKIKEHGLAENIGFSADAYFEADTEWCDFVQVPIWGIDWYNNDIIVNRIFASGNNGVYELKKLKNSKKNVIALIGTSNPVHLKSFVSSFV